MCRFVALLSLLWYHGLDYIVNTSPLKILIIIQARMSYALYYKLVNSAE